MNTLLIIALILIIVRQIVDYYNTKWDKAYLDNNKVNNPNVHWYNWYLLINIKMILAIIIGVLLFVWAINK